MNELRIAARRLRSDRWSAAGAILAAALGAGLNTAVFAVAYGVLLRPLPYADPDRLVIVDADARFESVQRWRDGLPAFEDVSAYAPAFLTTRGVGDTRVATVAVVDERFFATLGARPHAGSAFGSGDASSVVISERLSREAGGGDALLGTQVSIADTPLTIAGIMPAAFGFPSERTDIWMPVRAAPKIAFDRSADARRFRLVGRLAAGASFAQARDQVANVRAHLDPDARPRRNADVGVQRLEDAVVGSVRPVLLAFAVAGALVLLIACANVATILVGRTLGRQRELGVRRALGASSAQLLASVVSESLVITSVGATLGVAIAAVAVRLLERWAAGSVPRLADIHLDWRVLAFAVASTAVASIVSAAPAFRAARRATAGLRAQAAGTSRLDRRTRGALIVAQIALAVVLLASGGLLTRTIVGLLRIDLGVATRGSVVSQLMLTDTVTFDAAGRAPLLLEALRRVRALPGVTAAGAGSTMPPDNASLELRVTLVGETGRRSYSLALGSATPGFLPAIGARLLHGRDFEDADDRGDRPVAILSESAARQLMARDARDGLGGVVGRELPMPLVGPLRGRPRATVIGIVSDIRYLGLEANAGPTIYVMWTAMPAGHAFLAARTASATSIAPSLRAILRELDPRMPLMPVRTLDEVVQRTVADERLRALLGGSVALLAFAVAMVGLAGSLARVVSERRQELAIRAALGATPARTVRTIMHEGVLLAILGVTLGLGGALAAGRALRAFLHGVAPNDPVTLIGVAVFVAATSLAACYLPARRAARIDPLALLRHE
jgi:predicted permease